MDEKQAKRFVEVIESANYEVRAYSGRGMYGRSCIGIDVAQGVSMFKVGVDVANMATTLGYEDLAEDIGDLRVAQDSMGLGAIVYFPNVAWPEEEAEDVDDEPGDDSAGETEPGRGND